MDAAEELRVSVATYNQVLFPHPENGMTMLALERKATVLEDGSVRVLAQPFGGSIRILEAAALQKIIGEIRFDSGRSKQERDFRILIPSAKWDLVKQYCLYHLENPDDSELEATPDRELVEEFEETIRFDLKPDHYTVQPLGFVVENHPVRTENRYARGYPTVRVYRICIVQVVDVALGRVILTASQGYSDQELEALALKDLRDGGRGKANSILSLPLATVLGAFGALKPEARFRKILLEEHLLDESVLAILMDVDVPQYQRIKNEHLLTGLCTG